MHYSLIAALWLGCGLVAAMSMLVRLGSTGEWKGALVLLWIHRVFGGVFYVGYVVFLDLMARLYVTDAPLVSSAIAFHVVLGMLLFGLILFKESIVRFFKRFYPALPYFGMAVFTIAAVLFGLTGGHNIMLWIEGPRVEVRQDGKARVVSVALGRDIQHRKCSRCHDLKTVYLFRRTEAEWQNTVKRMAAKDLGLISAVQADAIVGFLAKELGAEE